MARQSRNSDDVDKFVGNRSLPAAVVLHLQQGNHVTHILLCIIHGIAAKHSKWLQSNEMTLAVYKALIWQACPSSICKLQSCRT